MVCIGKSIQRRKTAAENKSPVNNLMPVLPAFHNCVPPEYKTRFRRNRIKYQDIKKGLEAIPANTIANGTEINITGPFYENESREYQRISLEYGFVDFTWANMFRYRINAEKNGYDLLKTLGEEQPFSVTHPLTPYMYERQDYTEEELENAQDDFDEELLGEIKDMKQFEEHVNKAGKTTIPLPALRCNPYADSGNIEYSIMSVFLIILTEQEYEKWPDLGDIYDEHLNATYEDAMNIGNPKIGGFTKIFQTEKELKNIIRDIKNIIDYTAKLHEIIKTYTDFVDTITL